MRQGVKSHSTPRVHTSGLLSSVPTSGVTMEKKRLASYCVGNKHLDRDDASPGSSVVIVPDSQVSQEVILCHADMGCCRQRQQAATSWRNNE